MLRVPVECKTEPAPRNSRHLKMAWFKVWYRPAINAMAARLGCPRERNISAAPKPIRMMPMFSMLW